MLFFADQVVIGIQAVEGDVEVSHGRAVTGLPVVTVKFVVEGAVFAIEAFVLRGERIELILLCWPVEVQVLAECHVERHESVAGAEVNFLIGVVEVTRVVVARESDAIAEIAECAAIAEVTVNLEAVPGQFADIGRPDARVETAVAIIDASGCG